MRHSLKNHLGEVGVFVSCQTYRNSQAFVCYSINVIFWITSVYLINFLKLYSLTLTFRILILLKCCSSLQYFSFNLSYSFICREKECSQKSVLDFMEQKSLVLSSIFTRKISSIVT